jgi:hypothetical protein
MRHDADERQRDDVFLRSMLPPPACCRAQAQACAWASAIRVREVREALGGTVSPIDNVLSGLDRVRRTGASSWVARCPAHDDRNPSLAIRETEDGRALLHCFGGCSVDAVLRALNLEMESLFPPRDPTPGGGHRRERRPWRASDLLTLAAAESTIVAVVASQLARGDDVPEPDLARLQVALGRLVDMAHHATSPAPPARA